MEKTAFENPARLEGVREGVGRREFSREEVRAIRILLLLAAGGELMGPLADLILNALGKVPQPFFPTSFWNFLFCALLTFTALLTLSTSLPFATRFLMYGSLLFAPFAIHQLGGALSPVPFFMLFPLLLAGFALPAWESITSFFIVLGELVVTLFWEVDHPPPPLHQNRTLYFGTYILVRMIGIAVLAYLLFQVHRRALSALREQEKAYRELYEAKEQQAAELNKALKEREKALSARSQFLASLSHELRTPLASIVGVAEILYRKGEETPREMIHTMHAAAVHTLRIVDNLLDLTRIESGDLSPRLSEFNPRIVLDEVVSLSRTLAQPGCELRLFLGNLPPRVISDEEKLRRICLNLLSNALKATPEGIVTVRGWYEGGRLHVEVHDTGIGFDPSLLEKGEREPLQGGSGFRREGMGLGLRITRKLLEALGGEWSLHSRPGGGTRVLFAVPVTLPAEFRSVRGSELREGGKEPQPARILIVDDHPEILEVFRLHCEMCGYEALTASSVDEGLLMLKKNLPLSLILLDLRMPGKDGYEGLRIYRHFLEENRLKIPIYALTAHVSGNDETELREQGFDGFIAKPVGYEEFRRKLQEAIGC